MWIDQLIELVLILTAAAIASALTLWVVRATVQRQARRSGSAAGARGVWWVAWISFIPALLVGVFVGDKLYSALSIGAWGFGLGRFAAVNAVARALNQPHLIPVVFAIATGLAAALLIWLVSTLAAIFLMRGSTSAKVTA